MGWLSWGSLIWTISSGSSHAVFREEQAGGPLHISRTFQAGEDGQIHVCATAMGGRDGGYYVSSPGLRGASYPLAVCGCIFALGLHGKVLVARVGPYRVWSWEKLLEASHLSDRANVRCHQDRSAMAKAKSISSGGGTFGTTYKKGKKPKPLAGAIAA